MQNKIGSVSYYLPQTVLTNDDLKNEFPDLKIKELTRLTGVFSRHISGDDETSVDMALNAAENLFSENNINRNDIDFVLFCSAGGDYITPPSACIIQDKLGLSQNCGALDINQGCTGFIYSLFVAEGLISTGNAKNVLVLNSEAVTKTINKNDKTNRAIFGDAAAATIITKNEKSTFDSKFIFGTDGSKFDRIIIKYGRERYPLSRFTQNNTDGENGNTRNYANFYMNGTDVFNFSIQKAPQLVNALLQSHNISKEDIDFFIFHQANAIILETIARKTGIPNEKLIVELGNTGNTISASIPLALKKSLEKGVIKRGDKILLAGFGVGFSWGGTILEF
jgi:3-oxoacyl-[acyl-carrier-protein] synthase-3